MRTPETITTLNFLIRSCRDAEWLCRAAGATADGTHTRYRLRQRSEEWGRQGDELQALVLLLGGEPAIGPTPAARLRSLWLGARAGIAGRSDPFVVEACEQASHRALGCYERALGGYLPERIRRTVGMQARQVFARCDRIVEPRGHLAAP
ncbi:MAG TPA: PA2169 family four-helix-bundle protein [Steroidobacteraceae bacterium]